MANESLTAGQPLSSWATGRISSEDSDIPVAAIEIKNPVAASTTETPTEGWKS